MIYFLQADIIGRIKIGHTSKANADSRLEALRTASPVPLRLLATMKGNRTREQRLHLRFAASRVHGEWFEPTPKLIRFIARQQGIEVRANRGIASSKFTSPTYTAILEFLGSALDVVTCPELAKHLGKNNEYIRPYLHRLTRGGKARRVGRGWVRS